MAGGGKTIKISTFEANWSNSNLHGRSFVLHHSRRRTIRSPLGSRLHWCKASLPREVANLLRFILQRTSRISPGTIRLPATPPLQSRHEREHTWTVKLSRQKVLVVLFRRFVNRETKKKPTFRHLPLLLRATQNERRTMACHYPQNGKARNPARKVRCNWTPSPSTARKVR